MRYPSPHAHTRSNYSNGDISTLQEALSAPEWHGGRGGGAPSRNQVQRVSQDPYHTCHRKHQGYVRLVSWTRLASNMELISLLYLLQLKQ